MAVIPVTDLGSPLSAESVELLNHSSPGVNRTAIVRAMQVRSDQVRRVHDG